MASKNLCDRSVSDVFGGLELSDIESPVEQQDDPCNMPQSDDSRDISSIIVVDSKSSSEVSFIDPDDLGPIGSSFSEDHNENHITIEETESEVADERDPSIDKDSATSGANMDTSKLSKSGSKRSSFSFSDDDVPSKKHMIASSSSPKIVTRSGRAVRMRLDKKFDYSSSQPEDEETQDSLASSALDSDDEEFQLNARNEEHNWSSRKRRHYSHESSHTSTTSTGSSSQTESTLIYLNLEPQVASIMHEPFANLVLEDDADLKTKIHKFLGLIPRRRKLYNPDDHLEPEEPPHNEAAHDTCSLLQEPAQPMGLNASHHQTLLVNTSTIDAETPDHIKAPIDLTDLPSEKSRANNCRRHKGCIDCLEQNPLSYSFLDSLNPAVPITECHPQALKYRKSDFEGCKKALTNLLFNVFNHAVFHCALQPDIVWKSSLGKPCRCEMTIDSSGQRSFRLLMWQDIQSAGRLIKPLLHEMCHAAAFVFNRETGHGEACRQWAYQANQQMSALTLIDACHARFKYVCSMCGRGSYGLMDFAVGKEMLRCHYCQFEVFVEPWSPDNAYDCIRPDTTMTEFKKFVFDKYQQLAEHEGDGSHSTKMRCLNQQYLEMKLQAACD